MSGVFGLVQDRPGSAAAMLERMAAVLCHVPEQLFQTATVALGVGLGCAGIGIFNRRPQPVYGPGGKVALVLSGELYHQGARRAEMARQGAIFRECDDADLALAVYLREGAEGLTRLEGAFTIAVWDGERHYLVLVNDRFGLYPHYFVHTEGAFCFAPEMKGVLTAAGTRPKLDRTAIAQYVRFQQILGDRTWFEGTTLLPPASLLRFRPGEDSLSIRRYWDWDAIACQSSVSHEEAVEECTRVFQRAIDEMVGGPYRMGVYLSGGLDGRTILGFVDGQVPITTVTFGAPGCRDVVYAAEIARRAGSNHVWVPFVDGRWVLEQTPLHLALTEGMHSWIHLHGISTREEARKHLDVNLSGWDGGTVFGGSLVSDDWEEDRYYRMAPGEEALSRRVYEAFCQKTSWPGLTDVEAAALFGGRGDGGLRDLAFNSLREELARTVHYPPDRRVEHFYVHQHCRRSTQNMLVFMRSAVEQRCPYFDYDFVSFMYSLPERIRTTQRLRRAVITRRMPQLARVPYEKNDRLFHSNPLVRSSHAAIRRVKNRIHRLLPPVFPSLPRLYADYESYLRTDLREWAEEVLFNTRTEERGLFNPAAVRTLWDRHLSGRELWTIGKIAPLITIEMVLRSLYDGDNVARRGR